MAEREWKPGDVAMVRRRGEDVIAMRYDTGRESEWRYQAAIGQAFDHFRPDPHTDPRPLVVIDPEDREQIERLADLFCAVPDCLRNPAEALRAALSGLADPTPPKPEEPTRIGAVVEDSDGMLWTRWNVSNPRAAAWRRAENTMVPTESAIHHDWRAITAVRVLSEGVS